MLSIPGYQITEVLHTGARTLVYRGYREQDRQPVIFKTVSGEAATPRNLALLQHEYALTKDWQENGQLRSCALLTQANAQVLILQDIGAIALDQVLARQTLSLATFLMLAQAFAEKLNQIHQRHLIHKDINPSNLVVNLESGQVQIIDFGIASQLSSESQQLQSPGQLEGTLAYLSPEQTGRMNRSIDYRTDFYSLGATYYQMLAGRRPFEATDPMELVHCHLAKTPLPLREIRPELPLVLCEVVQKLMAKTAEQRYQSAAGLVADLAICRQQYQLTQNIRYFELGQQDVKERFQIPQRLYGREAEVQQLQAAFARVSQGQTEMLLVAGYSGVGKTSLVHEVHQSIIEKNGYFIDGKFDQFQRDIPYASLIQAFQELVRQLLTETPVRIERWKSLMCEALGVNAQVIIEVIPEVALIIGSHPAVAPLPPQEARNRFQASFRQFIEVFARAAHPLVLFLDDLQWADSASLNFLEELLLKSQHQCLLILGAYRDNEVNAGVDATHPFAALLEGLKQVEARLTTITLQPLAFADLVRLVSDTLTPCKANVTPLADLIASKTDGNPFFVNAFLTALYEDGSLRFDANEGGWQWNLAQIDAQQITANVVELMSQKLHSLPLATRALLVRAACIGHQFDLATLAQVAQCSLQEAMRDIWVALQAGLVQQQGMFLLEQVLFESNESDKVTSYRFRFIHDRVQQAAYGLLSGTETAPLHLKIAHLWLQQLDLSQADESLFAVLNQFHAANALIHDPHERTALAKLNLQAGKKAVAATAFSSALRYLTTGLALLEGGDWEQQYALTLALTLERAECEYINHQHEISEQHFKLALEHAKTALEKAQIHLKQIQLYGSRGDYQRAIEGGLLGLRLLGIDLPTHPSRLQIMLESLKERVQRRFGNATRHLDQLPLTDNAVHQVAIQLFSEVILFAYWDNSALNLMAVFKGVNFLYKHGFTHDAPYILMAFSSVMGVVKRYRLASVFEQKALELSQFQSANHQARSQFLDVIFVRHWYYPLHTNLAYSDQCLKLALESGNWIYAIMIMGNLVPLLFGAGIALPPFIERTKKFVQMVEQMNDPLKTRSIFDFYVLWAKNLATGAGVASCQNLATMVDHATQSGRHNPSLLALIHLFAGFNQMLFDNLEQARVSLKNSRAHLLGLAGMYSTTEYFFLNVLLTLRDQTALNMASKDNSGQWQKKGKKRLQKDMQWLHDWARQCPQNYQHKYLLCLAEVARFEGRHGAAADLYDQAIAVAQEHGFIHHQALANELAGRFYLLQKKIKIARVYLAEARVLYGHWGAHAKVRHMEACYPELLAQIARERTITALASIHTDHAASVHMLNPGQLDLTTVMKAAQAISGEIVLEQLLEKLMRIVLENAGAQHGYLLLETRGEWRIEAQGNVDQQSVQVLQAQPLIAPADDISANASGALSDALTLPPLAHVPVSLIQFVALTKEAVVLDDAAGQGRFGSDPYILQHRPKSVLCAPILHQRKLAGLLYLENKLLEGVFTADRLELLKILSAQAAIAIENARVYENLEATVAQRTASLEATLHDLRAAQANLIQSEKMAGLGTLTAGVAHEINNPTNFTHVAAQIQRGYLTEFEQFLNDLMHENPDPQIVAEFARRFAALQDNVAIMLNGTERIIHIVKDLRSFTRLDEAEKKAVPLSECLDATLNLVRATWVEQVEFCTDYADDPLYDCWPALINQVIMNLLVNACQAIAARQKQSGSSDKGQLCLRLRRRCDELLVEVEDDGIGIEAEILPRILEPFFTTKDVGSGTGLGLSISYGIIQKHHGKLEISSTPGQGSCFTIVLPYPVAGESAYF